MTVSRLDPGRYTLMIGNLGSTRESPSLQVVLVRGGGAGARRASPEAYRKSAAVD
jgi:hypothetical protein